MQNQQWCMCEKLKSVARDGHSTCSICGGKDAYGLSTERPDDKKKTLKQHLLQPDTDSAPSFWHRL
jgi:hypothetical protein